MNKSRKDRGGKDAQSGTIQNAGREVKKFKEEGRLAGQEKR